MGRFPDARGAVAAASAAAGGLSTSSRSRNATAVTAAHAPRGLPQTRLPDDAPQGYGRACTVPSHRPFGTSVCTDASPRPIAVTRELGLRSTRTEHHTTFLFDGIMVENHYDLVNNETHSSNRRIEQPLKRCGWARESVELGRSGRLPSVPFQRCSCCAMPRAFRRYQHRTACAGLVCLHRTQRRQDRLEELMNWPAKPTWTASGAERHLHRRAGARSCCRRLPSIRNEGAVLNEILLPEFSAPKPTGLLPNMWFKTRCWWGQPLEALDQSTRGWPGFREPVRAHLKRP